MRRPDVSNEDSRVAAQLEQWKAMHTPPVYDNHHAARLAQAAGLGTSFVIEATSYPQPVLGEDT